MNRQLLKSLFHLFGHGLRVSSTRARAARNAEARPPIVPDALEARRLFSVTASISSSVLVVAGTSTGETITVYQIDAATDQVFVDVNNTGSDLGPFAVNLFNSIQLTGDGGDDTLIVASSINRPYGDMNVSKPALIKGDYGDDHIWGSDQADTIYGNYGSDTVSGSGGNDLIYGGYGDDTDTAADDLSGDSGSDTIYYGEGGADTISGGSSSSDYMYGGDGDDTFFASGDGGFDDYIDGGAGTDDARDRDGGETLVDVEIY